MSQVDWNSDFSYVSALNASYVDKYLHVLALKAGNIYTLGCIIAILIEHKTSTGVH